MTEYARLVVAVDSTQATKAEKNLASLAGQSKKTEGQANALSQAFKGLGSVLGTYLSLREVARASEEYTNLTNKLRQVTTGSEQLAYAQQSVMRVARETGQSLDATASVYQRIAQNASTLGLTFAEVEQLTKTVSQTIALSGADASTASGAMLQFGQALASGALRGDELNSILEGTPALAQAIARGMGVSVGELRKLGAEGKITSAAIVSALKQQADEIDMMASRTQMTASQAATVLGNSFVAMVGAIDQATGASEKFAQKVLEVAGAMDGLRSGAFADFFREDKKTIEGVNSEISVLMAQARDYQRVRNRLDRDDPDDTVFFKFKFWNREELDAEIRAREEKIKEHQERLKAIMGASEAAGAQTPAGDAPATGTGLSDELLKAYEKQLDALQRMKELHGEVGQAARISYEIQNGALKGLAGTDEADKLMSLAQELDKRRELTEQQKLQIQLLRESGQLRAANDAQWQLEYAEKIAEYERQGNQAAADRLRTLKAIREIQMESVQEPGTVEGVTKAPVSGGLDAAVGGANSEIARLKDEAVRLMEWRTTELERQRQFLEAKAIQEEEYARRVANIHEQHAAGMEKIERAKNQAIVSSSAEFFGNMAALSESENKKIAVIGKMAAMAQATVQGALAVQNALAAVPPPMNFALAASVGVMTAANIAQIAGVQFATGGYTGPGGKYEPAGIVHKGEVVWSQEDVRRAGGVAAVEALRLGRGYANGGVVDMAPVLPRNPQSGGQAQASAPVNLQVTNVWQITQAAGENVEAAINRMLPQITEATARGVQQLIARGGSMARSVGRR